MVAGRSIGLKLLVTSGDSPSQQDEVRSSLMVDHKLQEKDFHMWRRLIPIKVLTLMLLTSDSQDEEYLLLLWVTANCECPLKKDFQSVSGLVSHFFESSHLIERCLKLKHTVETVMATYKGHITIRRRKCRVWA